MKKDVFLKSNLQIEVDHNLEPLYNKIIQYINKTKNHISQTINTEMVNTYWLIGREIIEEEQKGLERARYGIYLLNQISKRLTDKYGKGFSQENLKRMRQFYVAYRDISPIGYTASTQSTVKHLNPNLGWTHYRALMKIYRPQARSFYEIEAVKKIAGLGVS